ncbi:MAG: PQQ-like beta-propeller repeat protein [Planctomycetaceae bacterium]|nr:PQQ-like beta-propeller repeat protein [Planctomycetaceae bacterium]
MTDASRPQWRGPRRDGVSLEAGLLPAWPAGGPRLLWQQTGLGTGWSSPILVDERLYITGDIGADDGTLFWTVPLKNQFGVNAATPIYDAGAVFFVTPDTEKGRLYLRYHDTLWCYDVAAADASFTIWDRTSMNAGRLRHYPWQCPECTTSPGITFTWHHFEENRHGLQH